jgi:hypothetical protein
VQPRNHLFLVQPWNHLLGWGCSLETKWFLNSLGTIWAGGALEPSDSNATFEPSSSGAALESSFSSNLCIYESSYVLTLEAE